MNNKLFLNKGIYDNKNIYENTVESINEAIKVNLGLYLTVRETKDHVLIIYEDNNLSRLSNVKDRIEDSTYDEIEFLTIYHVPKLEEVLKLINGKVDIILNLKNKNKNREIHQIIKKYKGNLIVLSKPLLLKKVIKNNDKLLTGEILTKRNTNLLSFLITPDYKSVDLDYYDVKRIKKLKESNTPIIGFLINNSKLYHDYKDVLDYMIVDNYNKINIK